MNILVWICIAIAVFLLVLLGRTMAFRPKKEAAKAEVPVALDETAIISHMQALIRCKTISYIEKSTMEDPAPFEAFPKLLESLYPRVHQALEHERVGERGLLYRWRGRQSDAPSVLMSHYDVVPAQENLWKKPPFDAVLEDGVLWGRGTLDTKGTLLSILEAAESLLAEGFVPERDLYFSFAGDEEIAGQGAPDLVSELEKRGVKPAFVLDEGGAVVEKVFPGVTKPCALVGTGEKGNAIFSLSMVSKGGHASAPPPHTLIGHLAKAIIRMENHPFPFRLTLPAAQMFDTLGRHSSFVFRFLFANLWCFKPLLNLMCRLLGGEMNALVRTTCAFTQMEGSNAPNVLPPSASIAANLRLVGGDTLESAKARMESIIGNPDIQVKIVQGTNPSPISNTEGEPWDRLGSAIGETWPEAILSPYLMVAASDSRHYCRISEHVFRFSAMTLSSEERKTIHGNDERIPLETLYTAVRFYVRLMKKC